MGQRVLSCLVLYFCRSQSFNTIKLISEQGQTVYDYNEESECYVSTESSSNYLCSSEKHENSWDLFVDGQIDEGLILSLTDEIPRLYEISNGQKTEIVEVKAEFLELEKVLSMIAVGATGVGKSTLLNALLCPSRLTNEYEDCFFRTDDTAESVTKNIKFESGSWLGENGTSPRMVKLYDTPGLGDSGGSDSDTLTRIVDRINSEGANIRTILLVFKATDRFSSNIQKQLKTLEYILGQDMWSHVITVFTFWDFNKEAIEDRVENCIKERKADFDEDIKETRNHCDKVDFEEEKVIEWEDGYEKFLSISQPIPHSFPHPVFDYNKKYEKDIFFKYAEKIYKESSKMRVLSCEEDCQKRLEIALKNEEKLPVIIGQEFQKIDAGEVLYLKCHLYLGLANSTEKELKWRHNSTLIEMDKTDERKRIKNKIVSDVIKESGLTISNASFDDSGVYICSTPENRSLKSSSGIEVKILKPCNAGFEHPYDDDSEACKDIDECEKDKDNCEKQDICINTYGSWECCAHGHELGGENMTCTDIDECKTGLGCQEGELCFNTVGSFVCCQSGYELADDNIRCTDTNECEDPKICEEKNKECQNSLGSYECICIPFSYNWNNDTGDCLCNQGKQGRVCESCNRGAVLVKEKYRTYCKDQITDCNIYDENISGKINRIEGNFPNIDQVLKGYNILRGDPLGFSVESDPGFTSSPIFGYARKEHLSSNCEFKGYNSNTQKHCQGSSTSVVYTSSSDLLNSLKEDFNQDYGRQEIEFTYDQSKNAQFTNSISFGADVVYSHGRDGSNSNHHCVDINTANSVEIGQTFENNGESTRTKEETKSKSKSKTKSFNGSIGKKRKKRFVSAVLGSILGASTIGGGIENSETKTNSRTLSQTESNGYRKQNSQSNSVQRTINTKNCEEANYVERLNEEVANRTNKENGSSKGNERKQSFTVPAYSEFLKNSGSIGKSRKYFRKHEGAVAITKRGCTTYKLDIETKDPPTFTDHFKESIQTLHDLTLQTNPFRLTVVKTGIRAFNTTLNSTTERLFDSAFSNFIQLYGTHYQESVKMGGKLYAVSERNEWIKDKSQEDYARECVEEYHQNKYDILDKSITKNKTSCKDPIINNILQDQSKIEEEEIYSLGAPLGSEDDAVMWSTGNFEQPAPVDFKLQPIINIFFSKNFMNEERILAQDGQSIDASGIMSWFMPRFSLLTDSCRALINYRISSDFSSCEECPAGHGPTEDFRECKTCDQLVGYRFSNNRQSCEKCPEGQWPENTYTECKPCNDLDEVRFSDDKKTCVSCQNGLTPSVDSSECLNCSQWNTFFRNAGKSRCDFCPGGQGATSDHLGCEKINGKWEDWGPWSSCSRTCLGIDGRQGSRSRKRNCIPPKYGGDPCDKKGYKEFENCAGDGSTFTHCPVDGLWSSWREWSSCSRTCGGGRRTRNRFCRNQQHGGRACQGQEIESRQCNLVQCVVQPLSNLVTVSSDNGPASQKQYSRMGVFKRTGNHNGKTMWSNHDHSQKLFYSSGEHWVIGDPKNEGIGIRSAQSGLAILPVSGWQYYTDTDGWTDDSQLTVTAGQPEYPSSIYVSSQGPSADKQPFSMGQYIKNGGQMNNGKPMWRHAGRNDRILFYSGSNRWLIGDDPTENRGTIISVKFGLVKLPLTGWKYSHNGWHQDPQLKFL